MVILDAGMYLRCAAWVGPTAKVVLVIIDSWIYLGCAAWVGPAAKVVDGKSRLWDLYSLRCLVLPNGEGGRW